MILFQDTEGESSQVNTAPNIITDGQCNACHTNVNLDAHAVKCWLCKNIFHAINCENDKNCVSAPTVFTNQLLPALNNTGAYEKRFGRFLFVCDFCMTCSEKQQTLTTNDHVSVLDKKIDNLRTDFSSELSEIKNALNSLKASANSSAPISGAPSSTVPSPDSPWDDSQKVDHLKHMMVIKKDESGNSVDKKLVEKTCVENGVAVLNTFELSKSKDMAVILKSKKDADLLKQKLGSALPNHELDQMATRIPRITIVGLERQYSKEELHDMICRQNPGISALIEDPTTSEEDKKLEIFAITPLKNNGQIFKAILRVSNLIRSIIAKQSDRVYIGSQRVCKVYDSFFVLRCYNCQEFGHHSRDCNKTEICGHCSGQHQTRNCEKKSDPIAACCSNCKREGTADSKHSANSVDCPLFKKLQDRIRKTTPFHQNKL